MSVFTSPGAIALTRTPGASSAASVPGQVEERGLRRVVDADERLDREAADRRDVQDRAAVLLHRTPARRAATTRSGPRQLTSIILSRRGRSISIIGPKYGFVAALFTRTSSRRAARRVAATHAARLVRVAGVGRRTTRRRRRCRAAAGLASSSGLRASSITRAPAAASSRDRAADARATPPVTSATLPSKRMLHRDRGPSPASQVEAGLAGRPLGRDRVDVALAQDQVLVAADLDLEAGVGREQHVVAVLDVAHRRARPGPPRPTRAGGRTFAVAGMRMPARDLRSPISSDGCTRTGRRSCGSTASSSSPRRHRRRRHGSVPGLPCRLETTAAIGPECFDGREGPLLPSAPWPRSPTISRRRRDRPAPSPRARRRPARRPPRAGAAAAPYFLLTKPRVIELLLVTTVPAMILAEDGLPSLGLIARRAASAARSPPAARTRSTAGSSATATS